MMFRRLLALLVVMLTPVAASAHPMPSTVISLDIGESAVRAEIAVPLIELDLALGTVLSAAPEAGIAAAAESLSSYLLAHTQVTGAGGEAWTVSVTEIASNAGEEADPAFPEMLAHLVFTPPAGVTTARFVLHYDAVMHRVLTHHALVQVRQDWMNGRVDGAHAAPVELGVIGMNPVDNTPAPLAVDVSQGSYWSGLASMFGLGLSHIAEGTDHVLFLLTLLLPAPLLAVAGRWAGYAGGCRTLLAILKIVTAFTVGHSLTLVAISLLRVEVPQAPIEIAITATIAVSAVHALRPLFAGREALVALVFGLVHGTAFSFTLAAMELSAMQMAVSLLGFNLGIEAMQLGIVAVTLPALLLLARSGVYPLLRIAAAVLALLAALGWLAGQLGLALPLTAFADGLNGAFVPVVVGLTALGVLLRFLPQHRQGAEQ